MFVINRADPTDPRDLSESGVGTQVGSARGGGDGRGGALLGEGALGDVLGVGVRAGGVRGGGGGEGAGGGGRGWGCCEGEWRRVWQGSPGPVHRRWDGAAPARYTAPQN